MKTLLAALLVALPYVQQPAAPPATAPPPSSPPEYIVGPQDLLAVSVQGVAELTRDVIVDQDGTFDFPYIGRISAAGKGVRAIEAEIKSRLSPRYLVNPVVNVDVKAFRSQVVYVLGAVVRPGSIRIAGNATLMSVLAEVGFSTKSGSVITITRRPRGSRASGPAANAPNAETIKVNRKELELGSAQTIVLQDGDTISVPEAEKFTVTGYVRSPGVFELDGDISVLQALAIAGGATEQGATNRIEIQRAGEAKPLKNVKMSEMVKPGDIITVPRKRI
ncbi:MAG TPA: polysaccharide biosynthesis/export family protein [Vicinamibacterales bacterium]|nr:polysaccharide biosynthesis/export family protein [Vicinamibacterales bacterium]